MFGLVSLWGRHLLVLTNVRLGLGVGGRGSAGGVVGWGEAATVGYGL